MKIGIIGTGIAGLTAGWLFQQANHQVVLFEKLPRLGMSAHSISVSGKSGTTFIDVPPRMFNEAQWPNLAKLYDHLKVDYEPVDLSKSFSFAGGKSFLNLDSSLKPKLNRSLLSKNVRQISADASRLMEQVSKGSKAGFGLTLKKFLETNQYSQAFVYEFLYPSLSSTVCTCSYRALDSYPAHLVWEALVQIIGTDLGSSRNLMRTKLGSLDVATRLTRDVADIRFESAVVSAEQNDDQVTVVFTQDQIQHVESFDQLIVATQANHAMQFVHGLSKLEMNLLKSFQYEEVETIVHTDPLLMPANKSSWAHFNFVVRPDASMCSVWMNRFQSDSQFEGNVFQTISPITNVDDSQLLARCRLQRPIVTHDSDEAGRQLRELQSGDRCRRIWFCGSFAARGIPLLETGVSSSLSVAACLSQNLPMPFATPIITGQAG